MADRKVAIITGASRGIGAAIAIKLASMDIDIAAIYAGNEDAAKDICTRCIDEYKVTAKAYRCDVSDFEEVKKTIANIKSDFGTVSILVNNAGITRDGLIAMMSEKDFDDVIDINLKGTFNMIRNCIGLFLRAKSGCIVNISSISCLIGNIGQSNYAASKAGIIGLTRSVARELASKNIRCNAIAPGFIETDMTKDLGDNPMISSIPLGRMGKPEEVAEAVAYLVEARYVTGEVIRVDGGIAIG